MENNEEIRLLLERFFKFLDFERDLSETGLDKEVQEAVLETEELTI